MNKGIKNSVRVHTMFAMIIFVVIIAICVAVAVFALLNVNNILHVVGAQDGAAATATVDEAQRTINMYIIIFAVIIAAAIAFTVYCVFSIASRIQRPLGALERATFHLTRTGNLLLPGDLAADMKKYAKRGDEISNVIISFELMTKSLQEKVEFLEVVANGDLRQRVDLSSDEDYLGKAMNTVVSNLSSIVSDVSHATEQLSVGANELSIGAQSLSQSSSQQSATMDKLHESAGEIAAEAAENADRAAEASVLTAQIRTNATEGGRKMVDMTTAMSEINKASHSIGSVMKVIDEIAFQTNILALNAAVEAARAGIHGKGFAVVADEVRNLATKSGEAANDTNAMIADTISKSEMGTKIVDEAIAFFKTIEDGIANINELLDEIAKAAKSQSHAIEKVTQSLTDMTNVVYHNSATSQESAAASEQMSSQALLLKETVNRFLLEKNITPVTQLPGRELPAWQPEEAPRIEYFDKPAFNPTVTPTEKGGLSPAEIYAKALEREVQGTGLAPDPIEIPELESVSIPELETIEMPEVLPAWTPELEPAPGIPAEPAPLPRSRSELPEADGGFVDDQSKY